MGSTAAIGAVTERRAPTSKHHVRRFWFGLLSILLHAAVAMSLIMVVLPRLAPPSQDQAAIELVFEQPAEQVQPEPAPAAVATPPEPAPVAPPEPEPPPPPEPTPVAPPEPVLAPPEPVPEPPPPPAPVTPPPPRIRPPPAPRAPPRQARKPPIETPAPQAGPAAPPAPAAPASSAVDPRWAAAVSGWLASRKTYPEEARRRGEEGNVSVRFTVDRSGHVTGSAIVHASSFALLNDAALSLLRQAAFPAFPPSMTQAAVTITTTIRYSLR